MFRYQIAFIAALVFAEPIGVASFSARHRTSATVGKRQPTICFGVNDDGIEVTNNRREALLAASAGMMALLGAPLSASAGDEKTIWLTGKAPKVPGQKPKDKGDYSGTKKDPNFLRSISDCKTQCEKTLSADGLAKTKEDCLSDCQDICCTTYEQCTFAIVPRI